MADVVVESRIRRELGAVWVDGYIEDFPKALSAAYKAVHPRYKKLYKPGAPRQYGRHAFDALTAKLAKEPLVDAYELFLTGTDSGVVDRPWLDWMYHEVHNDPRRTDYRGVVMVGKDGAITEDSVRRLQQRLEDWGMRVKSPEEYWSFNTWREEVSRLLDRVLDAYPKGQLAVRAVLENLGPNV